ncbi:MULTISPECIES: chromosome segregation protein SMC [unclassified Enterococcus]|uniref:chromosome segregation protein SMC n=1 Tax=unclassified Enterococcus TaxID=2608891 RepID=UPI001551B5D6|nr:MULTISPECIES: chromosome segregation protein SMC [unclassified Enterococcus]MBS7576288.1 chromosome segregation protein SMC [Enterococcus sp. MMGLQ5-2]MBS7583521.1 chromosome segregation protein SMC [Enterococcus sp. MMGLQ5-1]NPD11383.1 chromosome segregation protein SMC [Enterococcus sp. MMGLQ5-1]NPD36126.1 chromosome segregation protein SMC [Enterococcus sp. MMGLQ5-2]
MYLKKIEINGFKSFANQTQIDLEMGVTGIVGPNGSGKSNITESLRWVLGEQSAKSLRGAKMPDIIFAGSGTRKPLGMAEVTLTLENSDRYLAIDHDEIVITRRLFKTGDSEFLINQKKVRLKDIQGLFMDTGLGRDSFSIISQGKVEAIFNSKPEERRGIFEEAAGVLKYKVRKKEAAQKILETNENIDRLADIIYELNQQLAPLKVQSEKAQRYLTLFEQFKTKDIQLNIQLIHQYKSSLEHKRELVNELNAELLALSTQFEQNDQHFLELKQSRRQLETVIEENQNQLLITSQLISELENQIQLTEASKNFNLQNLSEKEDQRAEKMAEKAQLELELGASLESEKIFKAQLERIKSDLTQIEAEMTQFAQTPEAILKTLRADYLKTVQEEAELGNQRSLLEQKLTTAEKEQGVQAEKMQALSQNQNSIELESKALVHEIAAQNQLLQASIKSYQSAEKSLSDEKVHFSEIQTAYFKKLDEKRITQSKLESLKSIQDNHSNYYRGVKELLNRKSTIDGLIGTVADLIDFDSKIELAVEVAIGGVAQQLVVNDEKVAAKCIQFLKDNKLGRATFLPLTTIKPRSLNPATQAQLEKVEGFIGILSEMIHYDAKLSPVFANLVGTTVLAKDFKTANQLAKIARFQVRIVTLTGELIAPGGSMSGGSRNKQTNFFTKNEIAGLSQKVKENESQIAAFELDLKAIQTKIEQMTAKLEAKRNQGEKARLKQSELQFQAAQLQTQLEHLANERLILNGAIEAIDLTNIEAKIQGISESINLISTKKEAIDKEVTAISASQEAVAQKRQAIEQRFHQAKSDLQVTEIKLNQATQLIETNRKKIADVEQAIDQFDSLKRSLEHSELEKTSSIQDLSGELSVATEKREELETKQIQLKFQREDFEAQQDELSQVINQVRQAIQKQETAKTKLELEIKQIQSKLNEQLVYLAEEYQLNNQQLERMTIDDQTDFAELKQSVSQLRQQIKGLGPVNLEAIEQFETINQRYEFLTQQREDLERAKALLETTINEMDGEVKARFLSTFEAIRLAFKQTFPQMFNGGVAELILTNPEDLLNTGIEIEVEPPGKKIQSLNLMSGGEKALTALALLFAIIKVRTIPFVVLDEVEAALDEANVARFGNYLQTFENKNQFIVVTHRKGTMEACDVLYGVTMHESGVSKLVSVKLKKAEALVK